MSRSISFGKVLSGTTQGSAGLFASAPISLIGGHRRKVISPTVSIAYPGTGADQDLNGLTAVTTAVGNTGTSPTLTTVIQGTSDFLDFSTTTTADLTAIATTVALANRNGIAQYTYALLVALDGSATEWVQVSSATATGAGSHTITRGLYGTSGQAFPSGSALYFTNSWVPIPTANATTPTMATAALDISATGIAAPASATIDSQQLGMKQIPFPFIRVVTTVGGSGGPQAAYSTSLSAIVSESEARRAK